MSEGKTGTYEPPEWLSWDMLKAYMVGTGLCGPIEHPTIVGAWAASGDLDTRAQHLIWNGQNRRNEIIPKDAWGLAQKHQGSANLGKGRLVCDGFLASAKGSVKLEAWGIEVRRSQLEELAPLPANAEENLARLSFMRPNRQEAQTAKPATPKSNAGRKPDSGRWKAFYFAAIELAKEGRLTADSFASAQDLNEELLLLMGEGAFNPDHTKQTAGQIFKKFIGG